MNVQPCPWPAAIVLALGLTLSSCAIDASASGDEPSSADRKDRKKDRKQKQRTARKKKAPAAPKPKPAPQQVWVCSWSPTYDDDWYNDVLCDNGIATERPRLREWDDFVEQSEIMESAREYARERNAG